MTDRLKAIAFDVDPGSLDCLRQALPSWEVEAVTGTTAGSLKRDWNPGAADLLVVGAREQFAETLRFCRCLRSQAGRAQTPLLLLMLPTQEALVRTLDAGASQCLALPLKAEDLADVVNRALTEHRSVAKTLDPDRRQRDGLWQDEGGEA